MLCRDRVLQVDEIYSVPDVGTVVGGTLYRRVLRRWSFCCFIFILPHTHTIGLGTVLSHHQDSSFLFPSYSYFIYLLFQI